MRTIETGLLVAAGAMVLGAAACQRSEGAGAGDTGRSAADTAAAATRDTSGMAGMGGMLSGQMPAMMDSMHTRMQMMDTASGEHMKNMLPMHRQMVANLLSQMSSEMRSMNMSADAAWTATADSVRQDLVRMPEMSAQELKTAMPAHHARVIRLMDMHRRMMGAMRK
jgi:hypothetical protein